MKSRVLQFLCSIHTIYVELPQWNFFLKQGGQEVGDRNKPFKSSLCEPHKDISMEQIREWIYTVTILYSSGPQCWSRHSWGVPKALSGVPRDKNCLHNSTKIISLFNALTICINSAKVMVGKTGALARIKAVTPTCTSSHCGHFHGGLAVSTTSPGSSQNALYEAVKIIKFIKFWPLSTSLFNILYDKVGNRHKALLLRIEVGCLSPGKSTWVVVSELAAF